MAIQPIHRPSILLLRLLAHHTRNWRAAPTKHACVQLSACRPTAASTTASCPNTDRLLPSAAAPAAAQPQSMRYLALPPLPPARRALLVHSIVWAWRPNTARRVWPACRLEPLRTAAQHPHTPTHPTALHCTHARIHACHGPGPLCFRHRLTLARPWGPGKKDKGIDGREKRGRNAGTQARRHSLGWTPRPARDDGAGLNVLTTAAGSTARRGSPPSSGRRPTHTA